MTTGPIPSRWSRPLVVGIAAATAVVVVTAARIGRSFDFDEAIAVHTVIGRGSARVALTEAPVFNNHPLFAVGQSVWWAIGGEGEARQRVLPIVYGALAVGLLAGWVTRRWGAWPGVTAGIVVALNTLFVEQTRAVRGYSLAVLGVVVALVALVEYLDERDGPAATWWLVAHGLGATVAVGTHLYSGVTLAAIGIGVLVARLADRRLLVAWAASIVVTAAVYAPTLADLRRTAEARGSRYLPWFGRVTLRSVLGGDAVAAWLLGGVAVVGLVVVGASAVRGQRRSVAVLVAAVSATVLGLVVWQVVEPFDLYPRFFLTAVPLVAVVIARAVSWRPLLVIVVVAAGVLMLDDVDAARSRTVPLREVAELVDAVRAADRVPCAVGGDSLAVYAAPPRELRVGTSEDHLDQFADCDVVVSIGTWGRPMWPDADAFYGERDGIGPFPVWGARPADR